jgi:hypothetical protein
MKSTTLIATKASQIQRVMKIVNAFKPKGPKGSGCVYVFLGKATLEGFETETIDGKEFQSKPLWSVDETKKDSVMYAGKASDKRRVYQKAGHIVLPTNQENILIVKDELGSDEDRIELERQIILELGRLLDSERADGCLVNIQAHHAGTRCYFSEAQKYKNKKFSVRAGKATAERHSADVICMDENKNIVCKGGIRELARQLKLNAGNITSCCKKNLNGMLDQNTGIARYFCYAEDYDSYEIKPVSSTHLQRFRLLLAERLDGAESVVGTASEIAKYLKLDIAKALHKVAQGKSRSTKGWTCTYIN